MTAAGRTAGAVEIGNDIGVAVIDSATIAAVTPSASTAATTEDGCKRLNSKSIIIKVKIVIVVICVFHV